MELGMDGKEGSEEASGGGRVQWSKGEVQGGVGEEG